MTKNKGSRTRKVRGGAWFGLLSDDPCKKIAKAKADLEMAEAEAKMKGLDCSAIQPVKTWSETFGIAKAEPKTATTEQKPVVEPLNEAPKSVGGGRKKKRRGSRKTRKH
jgi:hypothetical protein